MRIIAAFIIAALLGACETSRPAETRIISTPSAKPYRYLRWSKHDTPETVRQIKRHNRTHQAVINAEKRARAK